MAPRQIGHYEIRTLLGRGGIGEVYGAFDTELEREVAIKTLRPELSLDKAFLERFRAEATSLARLNHPNITTLYALFRDGETQCMVMELVTGQTLETILQRLGRFPVRDSLAIVIQAVMGLRYAHKMGVIHRDIKPSNLMLTDSGTLKIMDFGIARIQGSQRLTRQGDVVGTLAYASPEQLRGNEGDGRSDLYSLATVLYEMLSGRLPFNATSDYELIRAQVETVPPPLAPLCGELDPEVEAALMQALAKSPEARFDTVEAFGRALGATALLADATDIVRDGVLQAFVARELQATRVAPPHTTIRSSGNLAAAQDFATTGVAPLPAEAPASRAPASSAAHSPAPSSLRSSVRSSGHASVPSPAPSPHPSRAPSPPPAGSADRHSRPSRAVVLGGAAVGAAGVASVLAWVLLREPSPPTPPVAVTAPMPQRPAQEPPVDETPVNLPPISLVPAPAPAPANPAAIPPAPSAPAVAVPAPQQGRPDLEGNVAQVLDSGALIVAGKIVNLFSIVGEDGKPARAMQRYLKDQGNRLQCFARGKAFQCFASGEDVGEHALRSGWARTRSGAPAHYSAAEQEARRARIGVWAT